MIFNSEFNLNLNKNVFSKRKSLKSSYKVIKPKLKTGKIYQ